jgi:hypothetical protein
MRSPASSWALGQHHAISGMDRIGPHQGARTLGSLLHAPAAVTAGDRFAPSWSLLAARASATRGRRQRAAR